MDGHLQCLADSIWHVPTSSPRPLVIARKTVSVCFERSAASRVSASDSRTDVFDYIERFHNPRMNRRLERLAREETALLNRPRKRGRTHGQD